MRLIHFNMQQGLLKAAVWQEGDNFVAQCLNVDVSSFGTTKTEAIANLEEALQLFFEDDGVKKVLQINKAEIVNLKPINA